MQKNFNEWNKLKQKINENLSSRKGSILGNFINFVILINFRDMTIYLGGKDRIAAPLARLAMAASKCLKKFKAVPKIYYLI